MIYRSFWNYLFMVPLFIIGFFFLLILRKKKKERGLQQQVNPLSKEERFESLANPVASTALLFSTLIYVTFINPYYINHPIIPYPLDIFTLIWYLFFLLIFGLVCKREYKRYTGPSIEIKEEEDLTLRYEIIRKSTHAVIIAIFACYLFLGDLFINFVNVLLDRFGWRLFGVKKIQIDNFYNGHYTVLFFIIISFLGLSTSEVVRIFLYRAYPLKKVKAIYRRKETGAALGSHIPLTVAILSSVLIWGPEYPEIVMASISISAIGDAVANLIGKRFGKKSFRPILSRKRKTLEGLLTAITISFILSFAFLIYRYGFWSFFLALVAVGCMAFIDWLSPYISDNILNPIITSTAMVFLTFILRLG
ncbi:MAG: hypothetical protein ACTSWN_04395 [Promethearchaeota archaeon]